MEKSIAGIHHVTAITGDPQGNLDFYVGVLGLRFVKKTVNFDAPDTYHFYYGDDLGRPGTILTFFAWPNLPVGQHGTGEVAALAFSIPPTALAYWQERLSQRGISVEGPLTRFDEQVLRFSDPNGLPLELVTHPVASSSAPWTLGPIPTEFALRGFHSVTLAVASPELTGAVLTQVLGLQSLNRNGQRARYAAGDGTGAATLVDVLLLTATPVPRNIQGLGSVHHVAWRTATFDEQITWRERIAATGLRPTAVLDRNYFRSIYFKEPGSVLFEIATDEPGFAIDEDPTELGVHLKLPAWYEEQYAEIERQLPPVEIPAFEPGRG
ncbi:diguanylate cyclase [Ktedonobacteria bacterium brp13]|nr:diguanylate cyclase [Ktedonobacteria bacterium brp13]